VRCLRFYHGGLASATTCTTIHFGEASGRNSSRLLPDRHTTTEYRDVASLVRCRAKRRGVPLASQDRFRNQLLPWAMSTYASTLRPSGTQSVLEGAEEPAGNFDQNTCPTNCRCASTVSACTSRPRRLWLRRATQRYLALTSRPSPRRRSSRYFSMRSVARSRMPRRRGPPSNRPQPSCYPQSRLRMGW